MREASKLHTKTEMPSGKNLLAILVNLLADQEGVKITYEFEKGDMT